jgi:CMP-2-keto-3-deoxyoctulosonic acid synthetase
MTTPLILIPARLAATRLPGKPLAEIEGNAMIEYGDIMSIEQRKKRLWTGLGAL